MHGCHWQVRITFKNHELLRGVSWDVKRGERVGLVGEFQCWHIWYIRARSKAIVSCCASTGCKGSSKEPVSVLVDTKWPQVLCILMQASMEQGRPPNCRSLLEAWNQTLGW